MHLDPETDFLPRLGEIHHDPDMVRDRYAEAGIDGAVLSQPGFMGLADEQRVSESNDELIDVVDAYDEFYGLAALPQGAGGEAAADELERCLDMGFHGGTLETMSGGIKLADPELEPALEVADRTGAPILVHPKIDNSLRPDSIESEYEILSDRHRLNAIFAREAALSEAIFEVVHEGVLDDYPDLNLVFHHLGGNIASMLGRAKLHLDIGRWPGQEHVKDWETFKRDLEARVYLDTSGFFGYHAPVRATLEEFPSANVLFGTDAPYEPRSADELTEMVDAIEDLTSETDADAVLGGNTLDLLVNVD